MTTLRELLSEAGFHGQGLDTAVAVAMAESGGHSMAHNTNAGTGDNSYGLFQINMLGSLGPARLHEYGLSSNDQLFDPLTNAKVAYRMSQGGTNWTPWSTYKRGSYEQYLGHDATITGATGVPETSSGIATDPSTAVDPDPGLDPSGGTTDPFAMPSGQPMTSVSAEQQFVAAQFSYAAGIGPDPGDDPALPSGAAGGLGTGTATGMTTATSTGDDTALHTFLDSALAQKGDAYVFGAKGTGQADPTAFDCSGLTKWAAHQAGYELPDGAAYQYRDLKTKGMIIPVDQAIHTPGALLFHFAREPQPGEGEPSIAHVAISLGNGKTIEAADPQDGVTSFSATTDRFNFAAVIPGISSPDATAQLTSLHTADVTSDWDSTGHDSLFESSLGSGHSDALGRLLDLDTAQDHGGGHDFDDHSGLDAGHH